ncbi:MAG: hypothetical protein Q9O62_09060 [Ardenticatenia bacterium]|nr:hypothetical protein [Ardenticatenia bacterium]
MPSPTPRSGDNANAGVSVQPPSPTPAPAPEERVKIRLLQPEPGEVTSNELVRFIVQPVGLKANQRLVLLLGRTGEPMREHPVTWQFRDDIQAFVADVLGPPYGEGEYSWTVAAVNAAGQPMGQGEVRQLTWWSPQEAPQEGPVEAKEAGNKVRGYQLYDLQADGYRDQGHHL